MKSPSSPPTIAASTISPHRSRLRGSTPPFVRPPQGRDDHPTATCANYAQTMAETLALAPADRYLHTASFSFSSSIRQFTVPLACGASVVIASREQGARPAGPLRPDPPPARNHPRHRPIILVGLRPNARFHRTRRPRDMVSNALRLIPLRTASSARQVSSTNGRAFSITRRRSSTCTARRRPAASPQPTRPCRHRIGGACGRSPRPPDHQHPGVHPRQTRPPGGRSAPMANCTSAAQACRPMQTQ